MRSWVYATLQEGKTASTELADVEEAAILDCHPTGNAQLAGRAGAVAGGARDPKLGAQDRLSMVTAEAKRDGWFEGARRL